jgi:hypothetical protein
MIKILRILLKLLFGHDDKSLPYKKGLDSIHSLKPKVIKKKSVKKTVTKKKVKK